ncbi:6463_t:CDS:2, partial [Racocetra persica]
LELKMKRENYLVMLVKDIVEMVVKKVVSNLKTFQRKQRKHRVSDHSTNTKCMNICHVEIEEKSHERREHNDEKTVKINKQPVQASHVDMDGTAGDYTDYEIVGCILDVKVTVCGIARSRCNIQYKGDQCYYTIESGYKKATFMIFDENDLDKYVMDNGSMMKNDDQRENKFVVMY